jgi:uncharacterized protein YcaQ
VTRTLSLAQARRIAIAAQGLDRPRPDTVTLRHLTSTVERLGVLQIDSVNVLARAHLLPLFSRLGPYDTALLDRAAGEAPRRLMETWAHEASFVPAATYPLLSWNRRNWGIHNGEFDTKHPGLLDRLTEIVDRFGPLTSREISAHVDEEHAARSTGDWGWSWSAAKTGLEILFDYGVITAARRNSQFERVYDLTSRVLPKPLRDRPEVPRDEAVRELVRISARAHGIGTLRCLADYFRLDQRSTSQAIDDLVDAGELEPVDVTGWNRPAWLAAGARIPRRTNARALLVPFDPLVFERRRLLELFGMHYRIEIYTPAAKRVHGYYVLPFLLGEHLVARVDLKHDRARRVLLVRGAYLEAPDTRGEKTWPPADVVVANLADELREMARWLGADGVEVEGRGDAAVPLAALV